jgi:hypothetical protein
MAVLSLSAIGAAFALLLWASAVAATSWESPLAGTAIVVLPAVLLLWRAAHAVRKGR